MASRLLQLRHLQLVLPVLLVMSASSCGGPEDTNGTLARIKESGVLRWGADIQGGAPYIYENPHNPSETKGFEVALAEALAAELGVKAEFVQNDWSALVPSLERGTFDIAMNGLEVTPARTGVVLFTRPYYVFASRLMARRDDPSVVADLDSLKGKRVGTLTNSYTADQLLAKGIEPVYYEGTDEPYQDLVAGRIDAVFHDDIIAGIYGEPRPQLRVVGDFADGFYSIATPKTDQTLRDAVDAALEKIIQSGKLEEILKKENIWNDRQLGLVAWSEGDQRRLLGEAVVSKLRWSHMVAFVQAAGVTLVLSILAMAIAIPLGLGLAVCRLYGNVVVSRIAEAYVELYRGTPVLLQLYVIYYGLADIIKLDAFSAAILGLGETSEAITVKAHPAFFIEGTLMVTDEKGSTASDEGWVTLADRANGRTLWGSPEADGVVRVRGLLPGVFEVEVNSQGFVPAERYPKVELVDKSIAGLRWEVTRGQAIRGVVVDGSGKPVPRVNAEVER